MADVVDLLDAPAQPATTPAAGTAGGDTGGDRGAQGAASEGGAPAATGKTAETGEPARGRGGRKPAAAKVTDPAPAADKTPAPKPTAKDTTSTDDDGDGETEGNADDDLFDDEGGKKGTVEWPEDWREKIAGDDPKFMKRLQRFTSFDAFVKSQRALEAKLSSGEYKRALPEDATEEEKAQWRSENGIPDKPDAYEFPTIKGHEWSDADKAIATEFLADLHAANTPTPIAQAALGWYAKFQQKQAERIAEIDRADKEAREDALRSEYAPGEYRAHLKLARDMLNDDDFISPDLRQALASARTADGRRLLLHPDLTRFLAERGLEKRGGAGLISGETGARIGSRIEEIKRVMANDIDKYYSDGLDKELAELQAKVQR